MSENGDKIGRLSQKEPGFFLWQIPRFSRLPKEEGICFHSPHISVAETRWRMETYPNGMKGFPDRIFLKLWKKDQGPAKTFHCTVGVRRADGEEEKVCMQTVKLGRGYSRDVLFLFRKGAEECMEGGWLTSEDTLTLIVRIKEEEDTSQVPPSSPVRRVMPKNGDEIGRLSQKEPGFFLWQIPSFSGLPKEKEIFFCSSHIPVAEARWRMEIYPNWMKGFPDRILLRLLRLDRGPTKTFHCTVGVMRADGEEESQMQTVKLGCGYSQNVIFLFCKGTEEGDWLTSEDTHTLTVRIKEGEDTSQGVPPYSEGSSISETDETSDEDEPMPLDDDDDEFDEMLYDEFDEMLYDEFDEKQNEEISIENKIMSDESELFGSEKEANGFGSDTSLEFKSQEKNIQGKAVDSQPAKLKLPEVLPVPKLQEVKEVNNHLKPIRAYSTDTRCFKKQKAVVEKKEIMCGKISCDSCPYCLKTKKTIYEQINHEMEQDISYYRLQRAIYLSFNDKKTK